MAKFSFLFSKISYLMNMFFPFAAKPSNSTPMPSTSSSLMSPPIILEPTATATPKIPESSQPINTHDFTQIPNNIPTSNDAPISNSPDRSVPIDTTQTISSVPLPQPWLQDLRMIFRNLKCMLLLHCL